MTEFRSRSIRHVDDTQHATASQHHALYAGIALSIYAMLVASGSPSYVTWIGALAGVTTVKSWYDAHRMMTHDGRVPVIARHRPTPPASIDRE